MRLKFLLGAAFGLMLLGAFILKPPRERTLLGATSRDGARLRLLTWNIGYGDLESQTHAHTEDLPIVAELILRHDPDAVALQELSGEDQLSLLLTHLNNRYRGHVSSFGNADRVAAVLIKDRSGRFTDIPAGDRFAAGATFSLHKDLPQIVLVSAHADTFSSSRRRTFVTDVVDWARGRAGNELAFIAGDFNLDVGTRNKNNLFTDNARHDSESYAYVLKYFRDLGRDAGETSINDRRIDYIFAPREGVFARRAEVLRGSATGRMDHWPLLVEIAFK